MTALFDRWVTTGDVTARDQGRYRVLYSLVVLVTLPSFDWVAAYPDSLHKPPIGYLRSFDGPPPQGVLLALEVGLAVSLVALALGWLTRWASLSVALLLLLGFGFTYTVGKIDHSVLLVIAPLVLSSARWGDAVSVDALRRGGSPAPTPQWPLRYLALLIGLSFVTAAAPKVAAGWLSPSTQPVQSSLFREYHVNDRTDLLAGVFLDLRSALFWESLDLATIALEAGLVLLVVHWRTWRAGLAVAVLFHVGVYLMLNIDFSSNVLVYGAVVRWSLVPLPDLPESVRAGLARSAPVLSVGVGVSVFAVVQLTGRDLGPVLGPVVLLVGGVVAVWYLFRCALDLVAARSPARV